jgi:sporulation protein YlmC with PRC-barrel domain
MENSLPLAVFGASSVLGNIVKTTSGESLGQIQELVIDPENGRIVGALLSRPDLPPSDGLATVPWEALALSKQDGAIYVDASVVRHPYRRETDWSDANEASVSRNVLVYTSTVYKNSDS